MKTALGPWVCPACRAVNDDCMPLVIYCRVYKMAWDDWVFGIATGGLYNIGKTAYKASEAADQAGDAIEEIAEEAGETLAIFGSTFAKLGSELTSFISELEELLVVERPVPRDEDTLWDEEVERLGALREQEAELLAQLEDLEEEVEEEHGGSWWERMMDNMMGAVSGALNPEVAVLRAKLAMVQGAIHEILYEEPGVIPVSVYHAKEILERFNTLEQPRLEGTLDSVNDNMEEVGDILVEVEKLFVVRSWRAVPMDDMSDEDREKLERLEESLVGVDDLIEKNRVVSTQLKDQLLHVQPEQLEVPMSREHSPGVHLPDGGKRKREDERAFKRDRVFKPGVVPVMRVSSFLRSQPMATSVGAILQREEVSAYFTNYNVVQGRIRYFERERLKIEKEIHRLRWVPVEEPGLIPQTLDEARQTIHRFRTEAQPRVETLLDSVNTTILEAREMLDTVNDAVEDVQAATSSLGILSSPYLKIGLAAFGGLAILALLAALIVLVKLAIVL